MKKVLGKKELFVLTGVATIFVLFGMWHFTHSWKTYRGSNVSFEYSTAWNASLCLEERPMFTVSVEELAQDHPILIGGTLEDNLRCSNGKLTAFLSDTTECTSRKEPFKSLNNGLDIYLTGQNSRIKGIHIQKDCELFFGFNVYSPSKGQSTTMERDRFLNSSQYKDIVRFAESIKIKE